MGEKGEVLEIKSLVTRQLKYSRHEVSKSDGKKGEGTSQKCM